MSYELKKWLSLVSSVLKQSSLATNFCFGLILLMLEKIVEADFACPCEIGSNMKHTILFFTVPPGIVFFLMLAIKYPCKLCKSGESCKFFQSCKSCEFCQSCKSCESCQSCDSSKTCKLCNCIGEAFIYSIVPALTWLVLIFIDGRYYACLRTNWKGKYEIIENGHPQRWCKPYNSSVDSKEKFLASTEFWYSESQYFGFIIAAVSAGIYFLYLCCCLTCNSQHKSTSEDCNKEEQMPMQQTRQDSSEGQNV